MPSEPASPINLHQAMAPDAVLLDRKVTSDVHLPSESWHSTHQHDFTVAPLKYHDVLLGMPFLAAEKILIDPANNAIILPPAKLKVKSPRSNRVAATWTS